MSGKICLLSDHHVCINPRLWKEAFFYEKRGFDVVILTMWQSKELLGKDLKLLQGHAIKYAAFLNLIPGEINPFFRFLYRLRKKIASELQRSFKLPTKWAISYAPELMVKNALKEEAGLYVAHLECAFFAGRGLVQAGKKVGFDFEDWYSHDYLVPERPVKLLESLESFALHQGFFCTAASNSMAIALKKYYNSKKEINVIYNSFPVNELRKTRISEKPGDERIKLLWFSRTVGAERGIESFLKGLMICETPVELHLIGTITPAYRQFLEHQFHSQHVHSLLLHSFMSHNELTEFISQFSTGLAIEENINDNKSLTISNKILQYLQAGLSVIASDTTGQKEVAAVFPSAVTIIDLYNTHEIVNAVDLLKTKPDSGLEKQINKFNEIFSWEAQEKKLERLLEKNI